MKVLIICSGNVENFNFKIHQAFVFEQIESIKSTYNIEYETFFIIGKGIMGYLGNIFKLIKKIDSSEPDLVHAHFGLSGLLSVLQRKVPVVITFHGSDAYLPKVRLLSKIAAVLSGSNIFVSGKIHSKIKGNKKYSIVPCGIDLDIFYPLGKEIARDKLNLESKKKYILFSSGFDNSVKNSPLAFSALKSLQMDIQLIELRNKSREVVNILLNACDLLLLTSFSEGSPQIIKEAMACNCPIVATDVGDIRDVIDKTEGCYLTTFSSEDVADKINLALKFNKRTNGRNFIRRFDNKLIARRIYDIYKTVK